MVSHIYYITIRKIGIESAREFLEHFHDLPIEVTPATWDIIASASEIKARYALSYADSFAVASAIRHNAVIVTGDPEFKNIEQMVEIDWI